MSSIDQQFMEYIVKSLVGHPDDVKVDRRIDEKGVLLELTVNPEDLGRVIGKRGSTAQSLRTLLRALGTKNDARYNLKIVVTGPPPESREQRAEIKEQVPVAGSSRDDSTDDSGVSDTPTKDEPAQDKPTEDASPKKPADDVDMAEDEELPEAPKENHSDVVSRTRKELQDLDDLDV